MIQNSKVFLRGACPVSGIIQGMQVTLNLTLKLFRRLTFWNESYPYCQTFWLWTGPLRAFPVASVSYKNKKKLSGLCYKTNLRIMLPAGGRQGRTFLAEVPEIMELALAVEVHPAWPMDSLHHSCPHSALTLSLIWHWFNSSFQVFSTPGINCCFSLPLMPSLNQTALFWHWSAAKQPEGYELLATDSEAVTEAESTKWLKAWNTLGKRKNNLSHRIWNKLGF